MGSALSLWNTNRRVPFIMYRIMAFRGFGIGMEREKERKRERERSMLLRDGVFQAPESYKDVTDVVNTCHDAGISKKAVKLRPIAVIKG